MERELPIAPSEVTVDLDELKWAVWQWSYDVGDEYGTEVIRVEDLFDLLRRWES